MVLNYRMVGDWVISTTPLSNFVSIGRGLLVVQHP